MDYNGKNIILGGLHLLKVRNTFELLALALISFLLIKSYYPIDAFQMFTTKLILSLVAVCLIVSEILARKIQLESSSDNKRRAVPPFISIYLFGLVLLLNMLPGTNQDALFSGGALFGAFIVVLFEIVSYRSKKSRKG